MNSGWMAQAACRTHPDLGWINDPDQVGVGEVSTMAVICKGCPVRTPCEVFVDAEGITGGFWAGKDRDVEDRPRWGEQQALPGFGHVA